MVEEGYCKVSGKVVTCDNMAEKEKTSANIKISLQEEEDATGEITLTINEGEGI